MEIDVFISYHTGSSKHIVESIVNKLENRGFRCWYAPRNVEGDYAGSIATAINNCKMFLLVLNKESSESPHVLNELNKITKRLALKDDVYVVPFHIADEEISEAADYYIGRMHWIDAVEPPMHERIDELVKKIGTLLGKAETCETEAVAVTGQYKLISKIPQGKEKIYGRDGDMGKIDEVFKNGNRVVFLEGIGGIGKSELAKHYAIKHKAEYDNIVFVTYDNSIKRLLCDPTSIEISGLERGTDIEEAYFARKMQVLRSICNEKTLFIVDNFDVDYDEALEDFLEGSHNVIFTTRNTHDNYPSIKVGSIDDETELFKLFEKNYGRKIEERDTDWLRKLFRLIENHTYMIELIAKQMDASFLSAKRMYEIMEDGQLQNDVEESVVSRNEQKTAFGHLMSLFNIGNLTNDEKYVMEILSLMGTKGVLQEYFKQWSGIKNMSVVTNLVKRSWVRKEAGFLSLHPLVTEVVRESLKPDWKSLETYLGNMASFTHFAWHREYKENLEVADNVLSVLSYFVPFEVKNAMSIESMCSFLWQVGRFEDSIRYMKLLYDACLYEYGEANMITGFVAKALGGAYFNGRRERESVEWYEKGLSHMLNANEGDSEDLAVAYGKVARCFTWEFNTDFDKAKEYFDEAVKIRIRLRDAFRNNNKKPKQWLTPFQEYTEEIAERQIEGAQLEIGRMYQRMGNYEEAFKRAERYKICMESQSFKIKSNIAYGWYDMGVCQYHMGLEKKNDNSSEWVKCFEDAYEYLKTALESNEEMRGGIAYDTIDNYEYLGDVCVVMKKYDEASNAYLAAMSMLEKLEGPDSKQIIKIRGKMMF